MIGFFEMMCLGAAFFAAGWLWREETAQREEEKRASRRRAHRLRHMNNNDTSVR